MKKILLLAATLFVATYASAQTLTWSLQSATPGTFTKRGQFTPADAGLNLDVFKVGQGLRETFGTGTPTELYLTPVEADVTTLEQAIAKGQTLEVGFTNTHQSLEYTIQSISFDVATTSPTARIEASLDPYLTSGWEQKSYSGLITDAAWAAVQKNGTFQRVTLTLPQALSSEAFFMTTLKLVVYNAATTDKLSIKNIVVNVTPAGATSITQIPLSTNAKAATIYDLKGQPVAPSYKGVVIQNGRKFIKK